MIRIGKCCIKQTIINNRNIEIEKPKINPFKTKFMCINAIKLLYILVTSSDVCMIIVNKKMCDFRFVLYTWMFILIINK